MAESADQHCRGARRPIPSTLPSRYPNVIAIAFAALGLLRPIYAAAAMVLSSVCVVGNSMRLAPRSPVRTQHS